MVFQNGWFLTKRNSFSVSFHYGTSREINPDFTKNFYSDGAISTLKLYAFTRKERYFSKSGRFQTLFRLRFPSFLYTRLYKRKMITSAVQKHGTRFCHRVSAFLEGTWISYLPTSLEQVDSFGIWGRGCQKTQAKAQSCQAFTRDLTEPSETFPASEGKYKILILHSQFGMETVWKRLSRRKKIWQPHQVCLHSASSAGRRLPREISAAEGELNERNAGM